MNTLQLTFEMIQAVAIMNPDGFTINARTFEPITSGYAVAIAQTQNSFGNAGAARVAAYVCKHPEINAVGGWMDSETGLYYYDATIVVDDLETALKLGRENKQIAIFNLSTLEEIRL